MYLNIVLAKDFKLTICPKFELLLGQMKGMDYSENVENRLFSEILAKGIGKLYHLSDFFHMSNETSIRKAFQRLEKEGKLIRLARGIYLFPKRDEVLGIRYYLSINY